MKDFGGAARTIGGQNRLAPGFSLPKARRMLHGGASSTQLVRGLESLERSREIINADVLDAWFPPSPGVISALQDYLPWLLRTSPANRLRRINPGDCRARGVARIASCRVRDLPISFPRVATLA